MRRDADDTRIRAFVEIIGAAARTETTIYLTGGATAVLQDRRLVLPIRLKELFAAIEPHLYRFPTIDPPTFRKALEKALSGYSEK